MKVTRRKLIALKEGIMRVGNLTGITFACVMAKNSRKIKEELEDFNAGTKATDGYKEFTEKRIELCKKHADKDGKGNPKSVAVPEGVPGEREYVGLEDNLLFESDVNKLMEKYKGELDKRKKINKDYNEQLNAEIKFGYIMVDLKDVPETITTAQLEGISDLVKLG